MVGVCANRTPSHPVDETPSSFGGPWDATSISLDHPIGTDEEGWQDLDAEGLGHFQIDDQLEYRRLLDREVGGFCAFQNLVHPPLISETASSRRRRVFAVDLI